MRRTRWQGLQGGAWWMQQCRNYAESKTMKQCEKCKRFCDANGRPLSPQPKVLAVPELIAECGECAAGRQERVARGQQCLPAEKD